MVMQRVKLSQLSNVSLSWSKQEWGEGRVPIAGFRDALEVGEQSWQTDLLSISLPVLRLRALTPACNNLGSVCIPTPMLAAEAKFPVAQTHPGVGEEKGCPLCRVPGEQPAESTDDTLQIRPSLDNAVLLQGKASVFKHWLGFFRAWGLGQPRWQCQTHGTQQSRCVEDNRRCLCRQ